MQMRLYVVIAAILGLGALPPLAASANNRLPTVQLAQFVRPLPPLDVPLEEDAPMIVAQDSSSLLLRIDRLESQIRTLTGQIEQMQFQQRKMEDALRRQQESATTAPPDAAGKPAARAPVLKRPPAGDAFDPSANPNAPGAPRPLGQPYGLPQGPAPQGQPTTVRPAYPQGPIALDPDEALKPLDLNNGAPRLPADVAGTAPPRIIPLAGSATPGAASLPGEVAPVKQLSDYDVGVNLLRQGQYASAESSLNVFLQKNPKDRYVPDAVFYLGETFFQRQRHREAAEQYLKLSTDYSKSARAPDALVRLGMSLNAMGAKEQACATFGEVGRKYPDARAAVRGADREAKRALC